jgi:hypothetical protein
MDLYPNLEISKNFSVKKITFIALLCSIISVIRIICAFLPGVKPLVAFIIIIGCYIGPYCGVAVGVLSILVSNCFLGHGLWTIFQVVAIAIIGYLSGTLFKNRKDIPFPIICIWGGVSTFLIYNGIMTLYLLIFNERYNFSLLGFVALYFFRLFKNIAYAFSTIFFLIFLSKPVGRILVNHIQKL